MKARSILLAGLIVGALFASQSAYAADRSATYVANGIFRVSSASVPVGIGGYAFAAAGDPTAVRVVDTAGNGVGFTVCQELPGQTGEVPGSCGDGDDVSQRFCSSGAFQTLSTSYQAGHAVTVFISVIDAIGSCDGTGTAGTVTLRTA